VAAPSAPAGAMAFGAISGFIRCSVVPAEACPV